MRFLRTVIVVVLIGLPLARLNVSARQNADDLSTSEKAYIASKIYSSLQLYFAHWRGIPKFDLDAEYKTYLNRALNTRGRLDFDLVTLEFIAQLHNGHTHFFDQWLDDGRLLGFRLSPVQGKWVVTWARDDRLKVGDIAKAIDGVDIEQFMREKTRYIGASNERIALSQIAFNVFLWPEQFTLSLEDGRSVHIERAKPPAQSGAKPQGTEGRWLVEGQVAYIKIPSFGNADYERRALDYLKEYEHAKSLIIDVRGNGGGMTPWGLIGMLMNRPWRSWEESTPQHIALYRARGASSSTLRQVSQTQQPTAGAYTGRLIIMIDRYSGSASEDFVMPFKDNGRAEIIGETSQGSSGQPYFFDFGNGMRLMVGTVRYNFPDGSEFESVGIKPTIPVEVRMQDVRANADPVLMTALKVAQGP